jgi:hypothetical protein
LPAVGENPPAASRQETPTPGREVVNVTGEQLTADYKKGEDEADRKYRRKVLQVEAVVKDVFVNAGGVEFKAAPGMALQSTSFGTEFLEKHPEIAPGATIAFRAEVGSVTPVIVNLEDPKLVVLKAAAPKVKVEPSAAAEAAAALAWEKLGGTAKGTPVVEVSLIAVKRGDDILDVLAPLDKVEKLTLSATRVSNAGLKKLAHMTRLRSLSLDETLVDDDGLPQLTAFKSLEHLHVGPSVTDVGLGRLAAIKSLRSLDLSRSKGVTDAGLKHLAAMKDLRLLDLGWTGVTRAGLQSVASLGKLENLNLSALGVTDADLKQFAGMKLNNLILHDCPITDAGVEQILAFKGLKTLGLAKTRVTDAGLAKLAGLTGLELLYISETKVTEKGVAVFRKARPKCEVYP